MGLKSKEHWRTHDKEGLIHERDRLVRELKEKNTRIEKLESELKIAVWLLSSSDCCSAKQSKGWVQWNKCRLEALEKTKE